ncbi:GNAT family N-acetyltransferase [Streptomyces sp. NPDC087212]|uniref:GNAT family N-acetyltransferase n=1 Tax=Streptomyces sp. NPDC087212 TaxID=3365766 RepID=UPI0038277FA8
MPGSTTMAVLEADDALWQEYQDLTVRSYGHRVEDVARLREHGDARVAVRDGRVIGGGLALAVPHFFGGRPVPGACLAGGCIAPEARGSRLWSTLLEERLRPLKEQGAVLATAWTASTGYGHRMGWAAPSQVYSWTVPTDELRGITDHAASTSSTAPTTGTADSRSSPLTGTGRGSDPPGSRPGSRPNTPA